MLSGMGMDAISPLAKTIPESVFMIYQMTFAVITVALVAGSVADRMRFSAFLWFVAGWLLLVYVPIAHWVWGGGFLSQRGRCSTSPAAPWCISTPASPAWSRPTCSARAAATARENLAPYDLSLAVIGTGLLWVGWFGFNGGSALGASSRAGYRHRRDASRRLRRRAHLDGAGMVGPRQAVGARHDLRRGRGARHHHAGVRLRAPWHGIVIGIVAGALCYWACTKLKQKLGYDDSLDVFGVHGVGGATGTILAGVFAVRRDRRDTAGPARRQRRAGADPALRRGRDAGLVAAS